MGRRPAGDNSLTPKQEDFCREYLKDFNASAAALRAGYADANAGNQGSELLGKPLIQARIKEMIDKRAKKLDITEEKILKELARIAFSDSTAVTEWKNGKVKVKDSDTLKKNQRASIQEVSSQDTEFGSNMKVKQYDKLKALELLGKYKSLFNEKLEVKGELSFAHLVIESMKPEESN